MMTDADLGEHAFRIIQAVVPNADRATACLYFATAAASALGSGWRLQAGGAMLGSSGITGWGLSVSPRDRQYYVTADKLVDPDDGGYCGHCWAQKIVAAGTLVVDIQEAYYGPHLQPDRFVVYHAIPSLSRSIRHYHAANLAAIGRRARRDKAFVAAIHMAAQRAEDAAWDVADRA